MTFQPEAAGLPGAGKVNKHQVLLPEAIAVLAHVIKCFSHLRSFPLAPWSPALSASSLWTNGGDPPMHFPDGDPEALGGAGLA